MPLAQMQRKNSAVLDLDRFKDVWFDIQRRSVANKPSITINDHHPGVFGPGHQHPQLAAGTADRWQLCHFRVPRYALFDLGQPVTRNLLLEHGGLAQRGARPVCPSQQEQQGKADLFQPVSSLQPGS